LSINSDVINRLRARRQSLVSNYQLQPARHENEDYNEYRSRRAKAKAMLNKMRTFDPRGSIHHGNRDSAVDRLTQITDSLNNNSKVTRGRKYQFLPSNTPFNYMQELKRNRRYAKAPAIKAIRYTKVKVSTE